MELAEAKPSDLALRWPGATVVILASGQSLTVDQCESVRCWRESAWRKSNVLARVIVINTTFRRAPWADVLYACDAPWWRLHHEEVKSLFHGEQWTQDERAQKEFGVRLIQSVRAAGLGMKPGVIHQGGFSGYQSINLAYQAGARKIILLGYDMHGTHWHGKYDNGLPNTPPHLFKAWILNCFELAADLESEGVDTVNCTPGSALQGFRVATLDNELKGNTL